MVSCITWVLRHPPKTSEVHEHLQALGVLLTCHVVERSWRCDRGPSDSAMFTHGCGAAWPVWNQEQDDHLSGLGSR